MMDTRIIRKIESNGTYCIPMYMRRQLDIGKYCELDIYYQGGDKIAVEKLSPNTKPIGYARRLDAQGRLCIPKKILKCIDAKYMDYLEVEINVEFGKIILKKGDK